MYITILIVLLWFCIVCTAPACFSTFLSIYYRPYSSWKFLIFLYTSLLTFFADNIIIDWLMNPCIPVVRVACASIINEREVSITVLCLQCSPCYTAVRIKNCSKSMSIITVATTKIWWCRVPQLLSETEASLPFSVSYVQLILQQYESRSVRKEPL